MSSLLWRVMGILVIVGGILFMVFSGQSTDELLFTKGMILMTQGLILYCSGYILNVIEKGR